MGSRPFRFEAAWVSHPQYNDLVSEKWMNCDENCVSRLNQVNEVSVIFNKKVFGNIFQRKRSIINRLTGI